ncbi:MAG: serine/threonine protein kinase [Polyangiales bacterium]|jgi:serine/threonine protein kinase
MFAPKQNPTSIDSMPAHRPQHPPVYTPLQMPSEHSLPPIGSTLGGKYTIVRLLGEGGMGAVFEVQHVFTKKRFALKWMVPAMAKNAEAIERFAQEARLSCAIEHPNVVDVFDVSFEDGAMFLVMELLRGESLADRIARGPIDPVECVSLLLPVLHGLDEAHAMEIIHRDLKPDNLFLTQSRPQLPIVTKLLDFGISKIQQGGDAMRLTASGMMMGTAHYMAPEQARDAATVGVQADVYSLGVILYEAVSGRLPFPAENIGKLVSQIVLEAPPDIRSHATHLPPALCEVIMRALSKKPHQRPAGARALALELCLAVGLPSTFFAPSGASWTPSAPPSPPTDVAAPKKPRARMSRRWRTRLLAGFILAFAAAVATYVNVFP